MHSIDALMKVEDAHVSMLERVSSYYGRYVDTMWSVFVLHSKSVLGEDWWPSHVELFRSEYEGHISLEHELCRIIDREDGLNARVALDELHDELESRVLIELLVVHSDSCRRCIRTSCRFRPTPTLCRRKHLPVRVGVFVSI